jgi:hypothetical protein
VEKSCDGEQFTPIQQFKGAGTSSEQHVYQFSDLNPCLGTSYYRLSQTNTDGVTEVLGIRSATKCAEYNEVLLFPNPASNEIQLKWDNQEMELIRLVNSTGQVISTFTDLPVHQTELSLDVSALDAGVYFVEIFQHFGSQTLKLIIE